MNIQDFADQTLKNVFERWKKQYPDQADITFEEWKKTIKNISIERNVRL